MIFQIMKERKGGVYPASPQPRRRSLVITLLTYNYRRGYSDITERGQCVLISPSGTQALQSTVDTN
jgi:hypothetical protein